MGGFGGGRCVALLLSGRPGWAACSLKLCYSGWYMCGSRWCGNQPACLWRLEMCRREQAGL